MNANYKFQMEWHAVLRAQERFNCELTRDELLKITASCRKGDLPLLEVHIEDKHGRERRLYKHKLATEDCIIVYDPKDDVVVTFLGKETVQWDRLVGKTKAPRMDQPLRAPMAQIARRR